MERRLGGTSLYAHCASALSLLVNGMQAGFFTDGERNFGYIHRGEDSAPGRMIEQVSVEEVGARFAKRLFALASAEQSSKVMSDVLVQYGLESLAAADDRDRTPTSRRSFSGRFAV